MPAAMRSKWRTLTRWESRRDPPTGLPGRKWAMTPAATSRSTPASTRTESQHGPRTATRSKVLTYDGRGNATEASYLDEEGRPTRNTDEVSAWTAVYDARGNVIRANIFDEKGNPTRSKNGYAKVTKAYDARGNEVEKAYFDEKGIAVHEPRGRGVSSSATVSTP